MTADTPCCREATTVYTTGDHLAISTTTVCACRKLDSAKRLTCHEAEKYTYLHEVEKYTYLLERSLPSVYAAQHEGAYQIYKNVSDCPMYSTIAAQHAQQLVAAGVDFVVVDMTSVGPSRRVPTNGALLVLRDIEDRC